MEGKANCGVVFLLGIALIGCRQPPQQPVALQYTYSWNEDRPQERALLHQFTRETGIPVTNISVPEASREYVDLARKLLQSGSGPDLLNIDLIWTAVLAPDLLDLQPYLAPEIARVDPELLRSYSVNGKLVAVPFNVPIGGLEYRTDLLREYGYAHPPRTWDELESMAVRIQKGERAKGRKDFWGYVWQGNAAESLTCNALEWQVAAGGGRTIERDRTISVNNPAAIGAWQRARRWIGWISPPSVVSYRENDTGLVFDSGRAAFSRIWILTPMSRLGQARQIAWRSAPRWWRPACRDCLVKPKVRLEPWEGRVPPSPYIRHIVRKRLLFSDSSFAVSSTRAKRAATSAPRTSLNSPTRRLCRIRESFRSPRRSP